MKLILEREESPFVFRTTNESNTSCFIDAKEEIGGKGKGMRPMELVASGLAGCASIDVLLILQKQKIDVEDYKVEIDATRETSIPAAFESIHLLFTMKTDAKKEKVERAIQLALEKYCSVAASLSDQIKITYSLDLK